MCTVSKFLRLQSCGRLRWWIASRTADCAGCEVGSVVYCVSFTVQLLARGATRELVNSFTSFFAVLFVHI